jgi:hypothetical protein
MTRESRMIAILGIMAVVAVVALGLLAKRYAGLGELKSVDDLPPAVSAVEATNTEEDPAAVDPIEGFIVVRTEIVTKLSEDPGLRRRMEAELSGQAREAPSRAHYKLILDARMARDRGLEIAGIRAETYDRVRESFVAWKEDLEGADPELVAQFEANRERIDPLYLGDLEVLDQPGKKPAGS